MLRSKSFGFPSQSHQRETSLYAKVTKKKEKKKKKQPKEIFYYHSFAVKKKKIVSIIPHYLRIIKKLTADTTIKPKHRRAKCHRIVQRAAAVTLKAFSNLHHENRALSSCYQKSKPGQHPQVTSPAVNSMLVIKTFAFVELAFQTHPFLPGHINPISSTSL